jgi:hypothetical protein
MTRIRGVEKEYIIKSPWGILFMRYLGVNSRVYGPEISYEEFVRLTNSNQLELTKSK